jgi:hypothetical protein
MVLQGRKNQLYSIQAVHSGISLATFATLTAAPFDPNPFRDCGKSTRRIYPSSQMTCESGRPLLT